MVGNVGNILDGAQSARLIAIKQTARTLDDVTLRLASGLDVNSALDNPQNYFAALSLQNRAGDLTRLLDGIGQNIRAIQLADEGIEAALKIVDQAESYLVDVAERFRSGEFDDDQMSDPDFVPTNETPVTFSGPGDLINYAGAQDAPASGTVTTAENQLTLQGNFWKRKALNYTVTNETVLLFEYQSTVRPEISAIGFDNDSNFSNDPNRFFLYGSQMSGATYATALPDYEYDGSGDWVQVEIPVGLFLTGNFSHMTFIHDDDSAPYGNASFRNIVLREGDEQTAGTVTSQSDILKQGYAKIIEQLDMLVEDANYRGINLLGDETMTTYFNEDRSNYLVSEGIDATYSGLGLSGEDFASLEAVEAELREVREARDSLRSYGRTLATDLNIIQSRQDMTRGQINTAKAGADDLTVADQNEEGANLLALQTRQQIQVSVLALRPANILSILS